MLKLIKHKVAYAIFFIAISIAFSTASFVGLYYYNENKINIYNSMLAIQITVCVLWLIPIMYFFLIYKKYNDTNKKEFFIQSIVIFGLILFVFIAHAIDNNNEYLKKKQLISFSSMTIHLVSWIGLFSRYVLKKY